MFIYHLFIYFNNNRTWCLIFLCNCLRVCPTLPLSVCLIMFVLFFVCLNACLFLSLSLSVYSFYFLLFGIHLMLSLYLLSIFIVIISFRFCNIIISFFNHHPSSVISFFDTLIGWQCKTLSLSDMIFLYQSAVRVSLFRYVFTSFLFLVMQSAIFCFFCFKLSSATPCWCLALLFIWHHFFYYGKNARDVCLTCRCHLTNIMSDGIFNYRRGLGIN